MRRVAYYAACVLASGGALIAVGAFSYAAWQFWTDSFWAFAKVFGMTGVFGIVVALIGSKLFEYAEKD